LACGSADVLLTDVPFCFYRQSDFMTVKSRGLLGECAACEAIFRCLDPDDIAQMERQFADTSYADSYQSAQTVPVAGSGPQTRCALQADLIRDVVAVSCPAVLDIGCYDGELLKELERRLPAGDLHGFDATPHMARHFPRGLRYRFWTPRMADVSGRYDVIALSHTLMYVPDLADLMRHLDRLLAPDGAVFLQMPDVAASPYYLLMGDQYHYFTNRSLSAWLRRFEFDFTAIENPWFPREIVGTARRVLAGRAGMESVQTGGSVLQHCLRDLEGKAAAIRAAAAGRAPVSVLGATGGAAFVDSVLGGDVLQFVDESAHRLGTTFRGKPVRHPRDLGPDDLVIIPYGESGVRIAERFHNQYACSTFVA
jgi:SAM-dependent methyltransferase